MNPPPLIGDMALTIGGLLFLCAIVFGVVRGRDWLDGKITDGVAVKTLPLGIELAAVRIHIDRVELDLAEFKVEAAKHYVPNEALARLESRLDEGFRHVREELGSFREAITNQMLDAARFDNARRSN